MPSKLTVIRWWLTGCLLFFATFAFAQRSVSGKVTSDVDKQPIFGATVSVKGTNVATQTNSEGNFTLTVPSDRNTLVISFVGFESIEATVTGGTMNISMKERTTTLTDVVVTGYSSQAKKDITGSVAVVKTEDLKSVPASNAESQLQGRASGVTVTTSNQPGDGAQVRIRGFGSFTDNNPLFIIDGVPTGGLGGLNPNDIESMQVLKDAAAASIYGSRASSGVVIVTTKKGKAGSAKVSYNMYYGTQDPGKGWTNLLNTQEMADLTWLSFRNAGQVNQTTGNPTHPQYGGGANPVIPDYILPGGKFEGDPDVNPSRYFLTPDDNYLIVKANKLGTNWYKEITQNAPIMNHNISMSGGADKSRYMFSFDYFDQKGIIIENYFKRYTARLNTEFNVKKNIRIGENLQVLVSQDNRAGNNGEGTEIGMAYRNQPIIPVYDIAGNFAGTKGPSIGNAANPVATRLRAKDNQGNNIGIFGNMYAEVDFLRHFTARTSFGGNIYQYDYSTYDFKTYERSENNTGNSYFEEFGRGRSWTWTNQITYRNTFAEKHDVTVLAGTEAVEDWGRVINAGRSNYFVDNPDFRALNTGGSGLRNSGTPFTPRSLYSVFGKIDYVFNNKFLASATVRRDGSSAFGPNFRYGTFPAFSVGWRVSEEQFMKNVKWISDLKIRGSYGELGNQRPVSPANAFSQFSGGLGSSYYDINGTSTSIIQGFEQSFVGNPNGKWETNVTTNIGIDATLFNGKTEIVLEWYRKETNDLLFSLAQVSSGGAAVSANPAAFNVGGMRNSGIDLLINQRANLGGRNGVKLDATFTFTTYNNEITKIAEGIPFFEYDNGERGRVGGVFIRNQVGNPVASFYGYQVIGLFQSAEDVTKSPTQDGAGPGRFKYQDANGDGAITPDDRVFFGDPNPDFTAGLNLNFSYKSFDLSTFFYTVQGKDVINYVKWWTDFFPSFQGGKSKAALYESWLPNRTNTNVPIAENISNFSNNNAPNSYFMEDGSYIRMKNLTLGYTLPEGLTNRVKIDRLRIYVQATNLFTITNYSGLDPEIGGDDRGFGFDAGVYPTVKQYLVGLNLNF
ncbi:MAG: SusC/RagA family TonB-linked outer membrane protein [Flavitalea sp.]